MYNNNFIPLEECKNVRFIPMDKLFNIPPKQSSIIRNPTIDFVEATLPDDYIDYRIGNTTDLLNQANDLKVEDMQGIGINYSIEEFNTFQDELMARYLLDLMYYQTIMINKLFSEN